MRKLLGSLGIVALMAMPAFAATKATVQQLDALLFEMHQQNKSDGAVAEKLKDLELSEQLTTPTMNSFTQYDPGPLTTTQICILAVESALLVPPPSSLPPDAAPNHAEQVAIMGRAVEYAAHQYAHLPRLTAEKQTIRFQNGVSQINTNSSTSSNFGSGSPGLNLVNPYLVMLGAHTTTVQSENGVEMLPPMVKQRDPASQNGQISQGGVAWCWGSFFLMRRRDRCRGRAGRWWMEGRPLYLRFRSIRSSRTIR
jgi:hypothetical protein